MTRPVDVDQLAAEIARLLVGVLEGARAPRPASDPNVMTLAEAALKIGVDIRTLERWEAKGAIRFVRDAGGRRRLVDLRDCLPSGAATTTIHDI